MHTYQKLSIPDTEHFVPSRFPQLEHCIQDTIRELAGEPALKSEMLLSFVKDHRISAIHVAAFPVLAERIAKDLPLQPMEALFEAGRNNQLFRSELEAYLHSRFSTDNDADQPLTPSI